MAGPSGWDLSVEDRVLDAPSRGIPILMGREIMAPMVRFISAEPLHGRRILRPWLPDLQWVICGGESGRERYRMAAWWVWACRESP